MDQARKQAEREMQELIDKRTEEIWKQQQQEPQMVQIPAQELAKLRQDSTELARLMEVLKNIHISIGKAIGNIEVPVFQQNVSSTFRPPVPLNTIGDIMSTATTRAAYSPALPSQSATTTGKIKLPSTPSEIKQFTDKYFALYDRKGYVGTTKEKDIGINTISGQAVQVGGTQMKKCPTIKFATFYLDARPGVFNVGYQESDLYDKPEIATGLRILSEASNAFQARAGMTQSQSVPQSQGYDMGAVQQIMAQNLAYMAIAQQHQYVAPMRSFVPSPPPSTIPATVTTVTPSVIYDASMNVATAGISQSNESSVYGGENHVNSQQEYEDQLKSINEPNPNENTDEDNSTE